MQELADVRSATNANQLGNVLLLPWVSAKEQIGVNYPVLFPHVNHVRQWQKLTRYFARACREIHTVPVIATELLIELTTFT